ILSFFRRLLWRPDYSDLLHKTPILTEAKTYKRPDVTTVVPAVEQAVPRLSAFYLSRSAQFLAILAQFALIVVAIDRWHLESQSLARLMWLALGGFVIHHFLPRRFRLPFFAMLSLLAVITGLGHLVPGVGA